jgi:CHAD domain-containing protein
MAKHGGLVWNASKSAAENASLKLPGLAQTYFQSGRRLFQTAHSREALHKFRLETKRFRYTLELFRPCYGPSLDRRLAVLRKIQDFLGEINDCATTQKLVGRGHKKISAFLERRTAQRERALSSYWRRTFDAAGQERWWTHYLARFARKQARLK